MRGLLLILPLSFIPIAAHDMWIEPTAFVPEAGQIVGVKLRVGQDLGGDPLARNAALIHQFIYEDASGRKPIIGRNGTDPAGYLRVDGPGLLVLGYRSNPSSVELPAEKFNQYLREEGLDHIAAIRASRNQTEAAAHEMFSRCAKSLVLSGAPGENQGDRVLGFTLELVAERNPYTMRAGDDLPVRLAYEGKPLAGALIVAMNRFNPAEKVSARSDTQGRVRLHLSSKGMWLIKAVHMIPAPAGAGADWASFWASLTFELIGQTTTSRASIGSPGGAGVFACANSARLTRGASHPALLLDWPAPPTGKVSPSENPSAAVHSLPHNLFIGWNQKNCSPAEQKIESRRDLFTARPAWRCGRARA